VLAVTLVPRAEGRGADVVVAERTVADPVADQVRVRVHGAGLNRADLVQRAGGYPAPPGIPADVPGLEIAGTVDAVGDRVTTLAPGDAVLGIVGGGGQAQHVLTVESHLARVPAGIDVVAAGGIPEVFVTAHDALFTRAGLAPGERLLVHAVGSGVGTAAVQLARNVGATVVGTSRTPAKLERARELGLDVGVLVERDLDPPALAAAVEAAAGPVDVVLDLVGGRYLEVDIAACAPTGRIVLVGAMAGAQAGVSVTAIMGKRLSIHGTVLRPRPAWQKAQATAAFAAEVVPLFASGRLTPVVDTVLPLAEAARAYELLASDATFGKVVLDCR
jgi:putative PIG3 family NAD(P)H quinone oxidoreductase